MTESVVDNAAVATEATSGVVVFDARRWPLVWLLIKNLLLGLVTLGIYRFWAKTNVRRYFWRHVSIDGEPLEYIGRGKELLIGFLIAIVILAPIFIAFQVLETVQIGLPEPVRGLLSLLLFLVLAFLVQVAVFRMRRYRLTRTVWRGIRCGLDGSSVEFGFRALRYQFLAGLSLWVAYPWMRVRIYRLLVGQMRFGDQRFEFEAASKELYRAWIPVILSAVATLALVIWAGYQSAQDAAALGRQLKSASGGVPTEVDFPIAPYAPALVALLGTFFFYVRYRIREFQYFVRSTTLGPTSFTAALDMYAILGLVIVYILVLGAAMFLYLTVIAIAGTALLHTGIDVEKTGIFSFIGLVAILTLLLLGTISIVKTAWLRFGLAARICRGLSITNIAAVETVIQSSQESPRHGEGLADALDVGDF